MLLRADLSRFVDAQNKDDTYITILKKLQSGESIPWVWCVFPRLKRVKNAENSDRFITGKREAIQYLAHPVLGARLREITQTVLALPAIDIYDVFDDLDFFDFHSSMTLFSLCGKDPLFRDVLEKYFSGDYGEYTVELLQPRFKRILNRAFII